MICSKCGIDNESDRQVCAYCGARLNSQISVEPQFCSYHPGRIAVSICHACGVELCEVCEEWVDDVPYCHECAERPSEDELLRDIPLVDTSNPATSAGFGTRITSLIIDAIVLTCAFSILTVAFWLLFGDYSIPYTPRGSRLIPFALYWATVALSTSFYFIHSVASSAQTPGMALMDIAVVKETGEVIDYRTSVFRFLAMTLTAASVIGVLWSFWDPQHKMLQDRITHTRVVRLGATI